MDKMNNNTFTLYYMYVFPKTCFFIMGGKKNSLERIKRNFQKFDAMNWKWNKSFFFF